jgi:hypothetical protein
MQDGNHVIARVADSHMPATIMESEVRLSPFSLARTRLRPFPNEQQIATMQWVRERTSIPVPKIMAYELDQSHTLGAHLLLEKASL